MSSSLKTTFDLLAETANEAATDVLLEALDSPRSEIKFAALKVVTQRRSTRLHNELLLRWHTFNERAKSILVESSSPLTKAVRDAILSQDNQLAANGCDAVLRMSEYDLIPVLVTAAEESKNPNQDQAAQTILALSELLYDEVVLPRDYRKRRDPQVVRRFVVGALEASINRFDDHQKREIVEAFLVLTTCENSTLSGLLRYTNTNVFQAAQQLLANSPRLGVIRLVLNFLEAPHTPAPVRDVISSRHDISFLRHLLKKINDNLTTYTRTNLRKIDRFDWLRGNLSQLLALNGAEQAGLVSLVVASSMEQSATFDVIRYLIDSGQPEGRRAAAGALHQFGGQEAEDLMFELSADGDPLVQARVVGHLRATGAPGALPRLIQLLESPHEVVRAALRDCLAEFTFSRYLAAFDTLDESVRATTGTLVKRVDIKAVSCLAEEIASPARNRQLRAIEMAIAMDAIQDLEREIIALGESPDHIVRLAAVKGMACCDTQRIRAALRNLMLDRATSVKEAAERVLQMFADRKTGPLDVQFGENAGFLTTPNLETPA